MKSFGISSLATLALSFGMVAVDAHSFLVCTQKVGDDCKGYPRSFQVFQQQGDGYTFRPPSRNEVAGARPCDSKQAFGVTNYSQFPMASAAAGEKITLEWPARNHAPANLPGRTNEVYMWKQKNPTTDVKGSDLELVTTFPYGDLPDGSSVCGSGSANDKLCRGDVQIPTGLEDGIYTFQWFWEFNSGEYYSTCFEVNVGGVATVTSAPTAAPTTGNGNTTPAPTTPAPTIPPADCTVNYNVVWESGSQFGAVVNVNCKVTLTNWKIDFNFPSGQTISNIWNAKSSTSGGVTTLTPESYNSVGTNFNIGFNANKGTGNSPPTAFTVTHQGGSVGSRTSIVEADDTTPDTQPDDFAPSSSAVSNALFGVVSLVCAIFSVSKSL